MPKAYDATSKMLLELGPAGWLTFLGAPRPPGAVTIIDAELSTVTTAADKVVRVDDPDPWLFHLEFQAHHDASLPVRTLAYNALLQERHGLPVASAVVLLDRGANAAAVTGRHAVTPPFGPAWEFRYTVVRVWELPPETILTGPLAVLPLAPMAVARKADVVEAVRRVEERLAVEADPPTAEKLWRSVGILLSLRYGAMDTAEWIREFPELEKRPFFRILGEIALEKGLAKGRADGLREAIFRLGRRKFGPPSAEQDTMMNAITDPDRLDALVDRVHDAASWDDLLAAP